jgi:hypothetical protein
MAGLDYVNQTIGAGGVTGDIVTDGTIGPLNPFANVVDWNLLWNDGTATFDLLGPLSGSNSELQAVDAPLSATATQLLFNFSGDTGYFFFANSAFPQHEVCFEASPTTCVSGVPAGAEIIALFTGNDVGDIVEFTALSGSQVIGTAVNAVPNPVPGPIATIALLAIGLFLLRPRATAVKDVRDA